MPNLVKQGCCINILNRVVLVACCCCPLTLFFPRLVFYFLKAVMAGLKWTTSLFPVASEELHFKNKIQHRRGDTFKK